MNTDYLKQLFDGTIKRAKDDVPQRKCDVCNVTRVQDMMINFSMGIGSPGHPLMPSFKCPHGEHWACSLAHLKDIMDHCLEEMIALTALLHVNMHEKSDHRSHLYDECKDHLEKMNGNNSH